MRRSNSRILRLQHPQLRAEAWGIVAPVGRNGVEELLDVIADPDDDRVPEVARDCIAAQQNAVINSIRAHLAAERQLKRRYVLPFFKKLSPCLVGIEACASSHYWSRELQALGHTVRLMPPAYVKPYLKRQKNDAADAEAHWKLVVRPNMRFVEWKSVTSA